MSPPPAPRSRRSPPNDHTLSLLDQPPEEPTNGTVLAAPAGWPAPPERAVYHELLGEIVGTIAPHTEADPVAILTQLLVAFGAAVGRGAFFEVEATRHHPNEFMLLVGDSRQGAQGLLMGSRPPAPASRSTRRSNRGSSPGSRQARG